MFRIDASDDIRAIQSAIDRIRSGTQPILERIRDRLVELAKTSYETKSQGKIGDDGYAWKAREDGKLPIGIKSGRLLSTLTGIVENERDNQRIKLFFDHPFATAFDKNRPILPRKFPAKWYRESDDRLQQFANEVNSEFYKSRKQDQ